MLYTVLLLNIFLETRIQYSVSKYLFEAETFHNIINVFTVTLGQFNMSLICK